MYQLCIIRVLFMRMTKKVRLKMSNQAKMESDVLNLMIYNETKGLDLITSLASLKVILEKIDETSIAKGLEINNELKDLETEKNDELELLQENLRLRTLKTDFGEDQTGLKKK